MQIAPGQNLARRCQRCPKGAWRWALLVLVVKLTILTINGYCLFYGCTPPKVLKTKVPPPKDNQRAASATVEKAEWWQEALCQTREEDEGVEMIRLPMLARDIEPDQKDYNIYLGETGCNPRPLFRVWCSVESYAHQNPGATVWFLVTAPTLDDSDRLVSRLRVRHGNLRVVGVDLDRLFAGTPVEGLFVSGNWTRNTRWPANNLSNLLRNVLLWRWGGLNSDTDCLCVRSVEGLRNVIAYDERASVANNAIMHFDARHAYVAAMMEYHRLNFKARNFPARSLTSVLLSSPSPSLPRSSPPLPSPSPPTSSSPPPSQLLPPPPPPADEQVAHQRPWHRHGRRQEPVQDAPPEGAPPPEVRRPLAPPAREAPALPIRRLEALLRGRGRGGLPGGQLALGAPADRQFTLLACIFPCPSKNREVYVLHLYNKLSKEEPVRVGSGSVYDTVARRFCPVTYAAAQARSRFF
ncbi:uncharacterized protein [Penaeus vannamei]|uniref:uncharacterized protein n=1 Tax=Penaeus vannamei TaxID=6689 RepID=UPI00387F580B